MNSYEFPNNPRNGNQSPQTYSPEPSQGASAEILKLKQQLQFKQQELEKLKSLDPSKSNNSSPPIKQYADIYAKRDHRSSYDFDLFEVSKHPAFQQPRFTKRNPKVIQTNPISVYNDRSLSQYGSMIMTNKLG